MKIEIVGMGCSKCKMLYENTLKALENLGKKTEVIKVEDISKITEYGLMSSPALVVDGEIKSAGKILSPEEIQKLLK